MGEGRLKVVVAEDEEQSRKRLERQLREAGCKVLRAFRDGPAAQDWLLRHPQADAAFLGLHRPGLDGLAILKALGSQVPIVLVTAHPEHAVEAFEAEATDYLLKPVSAARLERTLQRLERRAQARPEPAPAAVQAEPTRYPVHAGGGVVFVEMHKTAYFEVESEVVWAHAGTRMRTHWKSLGEVEAAFPTAGLLRVHRHLLVRLEAVLGLKPAPGGRAIVRLLGGEEIEASRGGAPRLREHLGVW
jgi:DNA-binding LytR/AlgR family response regulator